MSAVDQHSTAENSEALALADLVRAQEVELRENHGAWNVLDTFARAYFGWFSDIRGASHGERLLSLLEGDPALADTARAALRGVVRRDDLPEPREVVQLGARGLAHPLAFPLLAGLEELAPELKAGKFVLDDRQARVALAAHYSVYPPLPGDFPPAWYVPLLAFRPQLVANVLLRVARQKMRRRMDCGRDFQLLATDERHGAVARLTALPLLRAFPTRCVARQLPELSTLLAATLLRGDSRSLLRLIDSKLALPSMNMAQRVYWLAAGTMADPGMHRRALEKYVAVKEKRLWILIRFASELPDEFFERWNVAVLDILFRLIAPASLLPFRDREGEYVAGLGWLTPHMKTGLLMEAFMLRLAADVSSVAKKVRVALATDEKYEDWRRYVPGTEEARAYAARFEPTTEYGAMCAPLSMTDTGHR